MVIAFHFQCSHVDVCNYLFLHKGWQWCYWEWFFYILLRLMKGFRQYTSTSDRVSLPIRQWALQLTHYQGEMVGTGTFCRISTPESEDIARYILLSQLRCRQEWRKLPMPDVEENGERVHPAEPTRNFSSLYNEDSNCCWWKPLTTFPWPRKS